MPIPINPAAAASAAAAATHPSNNSAAVEKAAAVAAKNGGNFKDSRLNAGELRCVIRLELEELFKDLCNLK